MGVEEDRQLTAPERRRIIIEVMERLGDPSCHAIRTLRERLSSPQWMIVGGDIDGLVSAMMVAAISDWRVGALVLKRGRVLVNPAVGSLDALMARDDVYGVDVWSHRFPSISNHPLLIGTTTRTRPTWVRDLLDQYDTSVDHATQELGSINLSAWAGIRAKFTSKSPKGLPYKYPLGTAQALLAALELLDRAPRFYDRQYLPWLVANCDGGVESIRRYPWNVEGWWSALAAVAGPASQSEALYRLVTSQRPTEFIDVDRRLRWDERDRSRALDGKWNLVSESPEVFETAVSLVSDYSGWPDPFPDGVSTLGDWLEVTTTHNGPYAMNAGAAGSD